MHRKGLKTSRSKTPKADWFYAGWVLGQLDRLELHRKREPQLGKKKKKKKAIPD